MRRKLLVNGGESRNFGLRDLEAQMGKWEMEDEKWEVKTTGKWETGNGNSELTVPAAGMFGASDLVASQVQQLIQAMAEFNPPAEMSWSQPIQDNPSALQQILAQYWVDPNGK